MVSIVVILLICQYDNGCHIAYTALQYTGNEEMRAGKETPLQACKPLLGKTEIDTGKADLPPTLIG